jgi:hypothetical protein
MRLNALELLSKLELIWNKIFVYYPERREKFIERFSKIGAVRFIIGEQNYCASWVKAWLKNNGILNKEYKLTAKGLKVKNCLSRMIKSVRMK